MEYLKEVTGERFKDFIPEKCKVFTKNWNHLIAIDYRTIKEEHAQIKTEFIWEMEDANKWYFCIRAVDEFQAENKKVPTTDDIEAISTLVHGYLDKYGVDKNNFTVEDKYIEEM